MKKRTFLAGWLETIVPAIIRIIRTARGCYASLFAVLAAVCQAEVGIDAMPQWTFADTEVSTNCPLRMCKNPIENVRFTLECIGLASNNVEVAFGRDANTNGVLEVCERGLSIGWDCGEWRLRSFAEDFTCEPATTNMQKRLDFFLHVDGCLPQTMRCRENGVALEWGFPSGVPSWVFDSGWDTLRLAVRGVDGGCESLNACVKVEGSIISFR